MKPFDLSGMNLTPPPPAHSQTANLQHKWKQWNSVIIQRLLESWILIYGDHL